MSAAAQWTRRSAAAEEADAVSINDIAGLRRSSASVTGKVRSSEPHRSYRAGRSRIVRVTGQGRVCAFSEKTLADQVAAKIGEISGQAGLRVQRPWRDTDGGGSGLLVSDFIADADNGDGAMVGQVRKGVADYGGGQPGKQCGITWREAALVLVEQLVDHCSGDRWLGPPKTKAAVRDVRLPPFLIDGLDRLLRADPYDTVSCTDAGRWLWRTTFIERTWRLPLCDGDAAHGWEPLLTGFRFDDLRHTHRTWMEEDGIAEPIKSQRLGHQPPGIRGVYAHVTEPMHPPLLAALQDRWLGSGGYK